MQDFAKLKVWQKAHSLAMDIYQASEQFRARDGVSITTQLRRAALSVPTNIAEGAGKASRGEFARFLEIALGSASETIYHLLVVHEIGLLDTPKYEELSARTVEVRRMLVGLRKRVSVPMSPALEVAVRQSTVAVKQSTDAHDSN